MKKMIYFKNEKKKLLDAAIEFANKNKSLTGGNLSSLIEVSLENFMVQHNYSSIEYFPFSPHLIEVHSGDELKNFVFLGYLLTSHSETIDNIIKYEFLYITKKGNLLIYQREINSMEKSEKGQYFTFETKEEIPREFSHLLIQAQQKLKFMNSTYLDI